MYFHALYTGTVPWSTSAGSLVTVVARASPALLVGEADLPKAGTLPFISAAGSLARVNVDSAGVTAAGHGQAIPCGPYHAGEEVL
jgi:hypothetical protein